MQGGFNPLIRNVMESSLAFPRFSLGISPSAGRIVCSCIALLGLAGFVTGCVADRSILGHTPALSGQTRVVLTPDDDITQWRSGYFATTSEEQRKFYRNEIIRRLMRLDDESFNLWSQKLYGARAISSSVADFATGIMGAFAAASGATAAQSLGLAIAGVSGARSAADRDIFLEKSSGALVAKMKEDRAKVDAQITQYLKNSTADYPLEQGLRDIIRYYDAGTLASASETLEADAKVAQVGAQAVVENLKGDTVVAPAQIATASSSAPAVLRNPPRGPTTVSKDEMSQLQAARDKAEANVASTNAFVRALRTYDRTATPAQKAVGYPEIIAAAQLTGQIAPDKNSLNTYYQNKASLSQMADLSRALDAHIKALGQPEAPAAPAH